MSVINAKPACGSGNDEATDAAKVAALRLLAEHAGGAIDPAACSERLWYAAHDDCGPGVVRYLLDAGADVNFNRKSLNCSSLHLARRVDVLRLLLDAGADLEACDRAGRTPLLAAADMTAESTICALLAAGANAEAVDAERRNALHLLAHAIQPSADIVPDLVAAGADVNAVDRYGYTPLACVVWQVWQRPGAGRLSLARALLEHGADPTLPAEDTSALAQFQQCVRDASRMTPPEQCISRLRLVRKLLRWCATIPAWRHRRHALAAARAARSAPAFPVAPSAASVPVGINGAAAATGGAAVAAE